MRLDGFPTLLALCSGLVGYFTCHQWADESGTLFLTWGSAWFYGIKAVLFVSSARISRYAFRCF